MIQISIKISENHLIRGWRFLHIAEGGYKNPSGMPEVRPCKAVKPVLMTKEIQELSWELMYFFNPNITKNLWRKVFAFDRAFTNRNGFENPEDPRADFINNLDLNSPLPKLMDGIICGGAFVQGIVSDDTLQVIPGKHCIDAHNLVPIDTIIKNHWYFYATVGDEKCAKHFPQGNGGPVVIPYILEETAFYPLSWVDVWENIKYPDPLKLYKNRG
jgi:hypothetical protein